MGKTFYSHPDCPAIVFDLASGVRIKLKAKVLWKRQTREQASEGIKTFLHLGIFVYSDEGTYPREFHEIAELKPGYDYNPEVTLSLWKWLKEFAVSPERFEPEDGDDFVEHLYEHIHGIQRKDHGFLQYPPPELTHEGYLDVYDENEFPEESNEI